MGQVLLNLYPNGLNSFGKSVIERPENMAEIKRLVSMELKKDMRIKLIDNKEGKNTNQSNSGDINLGIEINMIDE